MTHARGGSAAPWLAAFVAAGASLIVGWALLATTPRSKPVAPRAVAPPRPIVPPAPVSSESPVSQPRVVVVEEDEPAERPQEGARVRRGDAPARGVHVRIYRRGLEGGAPLGEAVTDESGHFPIDERLGRDLTLVADGSPPAVVSRERDLDLDATTAIEGEVLDPSGAGVPADVTLELGALEAGRARADGAGAFRFEVACAGGVLVARADGFVPERAEWRPGEKAVLRLRRGDTGALHGKVLDADGAPVRGAVVRVLRGERLPALAATEADGTFAVATLEVGLVTLEVQRPGDAIPALRAARTIVADATTEAELRLEGVGAVRVVAKDGDEPIPGARVQLGDPCVTRYGGYSESGAQPEKTTDDDGSARFESVPPGRYFVRADVPGRAAPLLADVEVAAGATAEVLLAPSKRKLAIKVVDSTGAPVEGVYMDVSMPGINWHRMPSTRTGADGVGTFPDLPPGLAEVHLGKSDSHGVELWRMVRTEAEAATFTWSESRPFQLSGRVRGYTGEVLIVCVLADVAHMTKATVAATGLLDAEPSPPEGDARVWLVARDRRLAPVELGAVGDRAAGLEGFDVELGRAARITARLVDAKTGRGIPGRIRAQGIAAVLEAQSQWLGGTDDDPWITINEWARATGPDGLAALDVPPRELALDVAAVGGKPARVAVAALQPGESRDLGSLVVEPR